MFGEFLNSLECGKLRCAEKIDGKWQVNTKVKEGILEIFKNSSIVEMDHGFCDKAPLKARAFKLNDQVRMVPGGSCVRSGAYIGKNVVIMPPSYVNIGAYVDDGTMVDSHVLVGSCAQIGKKVHLSTGVQIGGVLEPIASRPVIIEGNCFIGAGVIITEGVYVEEGAVIAPNVSLSASVPIYDIVHQKIYKAHIPKNAVVVPGTRPIISNDWAKNEGLSLSCAVIVKYKDEKTEKSVLLEDLLR